MASAYDQLRLELEQAKGDTNQGASAAEVHGFVTGWIGSGSSWQSAASTFRETFEIETNHSLGSSLGSIAIGIEQGLADPDFNFVLLLPEESHSINNRRLALSDWCRGFLSGFGLTGRFQEAELSDEVKELLKDFSQIALVDDDIPDDDENESDLTEITEYVRMGAIMVFTDCASKAVH